MLSSKVNLSSLCAAKSLAGTVWKAAPNSFGFRFYSGNQRDKTNGGMFTCSHDRIESALPKIAFNKQYRSLILLNAHSFRHVSLCKSLNQESKEDAVENEALNEENEDKQQVPNKKHWREKPGEPLPRHKEKDRSKVVSLETSMRYLKSAAYKETYGDIPVWVPYRRNFPGQFAPKRTRKTCIRDGQLSTGNPCPICRDEFFVVDYRNVDLLKQFISPHNGQILGYDKTGVCRRQQERLIIEIDKAKDYGLITFDVPFREYDYSLYQAMYESQNA